MKARSTALRALGSIGAVLLVLGIGATPAAAAEYVGTIYSPRCTSSSGNSIVLKSRTAGAARHELSTGFYRYLGNSGGVWVTKTSDTGRSSAAYGYAIATLGVTAVSYTCSKS